jgi:hypothetical protein
VELGGFGVDFTEWWMRFFPALLNLKFCMLNALLNCTFWKCFLNAVSTLHVHFSCIKIYLCFLSAVGKLLEIFRNLMPKIMKRFIKFPFD